jgi:hypothetical protein
LYLLPLLLLPEDPWLRWRPDPELDEDELLEKLLEEELEELLLELEELEELEE